jgi:outer membrane protein OmpA-like peptidoglycan-associated protein
MAQDHRASLMLTKQGSAERGGFDMALRHVGRCLSYFLVVVIAGWSMAGCVIKDPPAITELANARKALDEAKKASRAACEHVKYHELEDRYLQARGVYYACNDAEAIRLARAIVADANALACAPTAGPNRQPTCRLTVPPQGQVGDAIPLDASGSSDPDTGDTLSYTWDFGDGTPPAKTTFARATHSYSRVGNYTVKVTVDDGRGGSCTATGQISVSQKFVLADKGRKVLFDFNKATLKPEARTQLGRVLQALKEQPGLRTHVVGHTDSIGSDAYNMGLSQRRAQSVAQYLVQNGVPRQSITTDHRGEREPVASNATDEGRAQNRRVEITVSPGP